MVVPKITKINTSFQLKNLIETYCRMEIIETYLESWRIAISQIASDLKISKNIVEKRIRLQIPSLPFDELSNLSHKFIPVKIINSVTESLNDYGLHYQKYLENCGGYNLLHQESQITCIHENAIKCKNGPTFEFYYAEVEESDATLIEGKLHYLTSIRQDYIGRYGIFLKGYNTPICYISIVPTDRHYRILSLSTCVDRQVPVSSVVNIARIYGFGALPNNTLSNFIAYCGKVYKERGVNYFTTSINPMIGFTGTSMLASDFRPFALCPVSYYYDQMGNYINRRRITDDIKKSDWSTPPNILMVKGITRHNARIVNKLTTVFHISNELYFLTKFPTKTNTMASHISFDMLRSDLEKVWDNITRYHGTSYSTDDPISKGQCGVSTAYLVETFQNQGYKTHFCRGNVEFPNGIAPIINHCWLRIPNYQNKDVYLTDLIIDMTADQSGYPEKVICDTLINLKKKGILYKEERDVAPNKIKTGGLAERLSYLEKQIENLGTLKEN